MEPIPYSCIAVGDKHLFNDYAIPFSEEMSLLEKEGGVVYEKAPKIDLLKVNKSPRAFDISGVWLFGVLLFLPGWFAKKALDELYDIKIKPIVRNVILKADQIEILPRRKKHITFSMSLYHKERNVLVIVAVKEKTTLETSDSLNMVVKIHESAQSFIEVGGHKNQIHLYIIENGKVNVKPYVHENVESANLQIINNKIS